MTWMDILAVAVLLTTGALSPIAIGLFWNWRIGKHLDLFYPDHSYARDD